MNFALFLQQVVNGLLDGVYYLLIALGLSLIFSLGGIVNVVQLGSVHPSFGEAVELQVIAACVLGGVSLFGGRGRLIGTLLGAMIVTVFRQGLTLAEIDAYWQNFAIGSLILIAVALDQWIRKVAK